MCAGCLFFVGAAALAGRPKARFAAVEVPAGMTRWPERRLGSAPAPSVSRPAGRRHRAAASSRPARPPIAAGRKADIVFRNGPVYTLDEAAPWAEAVAVCGNVIAYVGDAGGLDRWIGPATRVVDLAGRMLMPGFIDAHDHLLTAAWTKDGVNLAGAATKSDVLARIAAYAAANPDAAVVKGHSWSVGQLQGYPSAADLDLAVADRPAVMLNGDGHDGWFNSVALTLAGIGRDTPDPDPGLAMFLRDAGGHPTGVAVEGAWVAPYVAIGGWEGKASIRKAFETTMDHAVRGGITACHDMAALDPTGLVDGWFKGTRTVYEAAAELEAEGRLPLRVVGALAVRAPGAPLAEIIDELVALNADFESELIAVTGLKLFADGSSLSHTGYLLEPYADRPDWRGSSVFEDTMMDYVEAAHVAGFDVHIHVDGDAGTRLSLDAIQAVQDRHGKADRRHAIHHCMAVHPDDVPRFAELGVGANGTASFAINQYGTLRDVWVQRLGEARIAERGYPYRQLIELGVNFTLGADIPGVDLPEVPPLYQIAAAITQRRPGVPDDVLMPGGEGKTLTLEQALKAYTLSGARQMRMEADIGSIETGKLADLVVLGANLFEVDPGALHEVKVEATVMNGRFTHDAL